MHVDMQRQTITSSIEISVRRKLKVKAHPQTKCILLIIE